MLGAAYLITRAADETAAAYALTAFTAAVVLTTSVHPLWLIGLGAALGLLGVV
jgi:chromate transporter